LNNVPKILRGTSRQNVLSTSHVNKGDIGSI